MPDFVEGQNWDKCLNPGNSTSFVSAALVDVNLLFLAVKSPNSKQKEILVILLVWQKKNFNIHVSSVAIIKIHVHHFKLTIIFMFHHYKMHLFVKKNF